jgi:hypothetical protein
VAPTLSAPCLFKAVYATHFVKSGTSSCGSAFGQHSRKANDAASSLLDRKQLTSFGQTGSGHAGFSLLVLFSLFLNKQFWQAGFFSLLDCSKTILASAKPIKQLFGEQLGGLFVLSGKAELGYNGNRLAPCRGSA